MLNKERHIPYMYGWAILMIAISYLAEARGEVKRLPEEGIKSGASNLEIVGNNV